MLIFRCPECGLLAIVGGEPCFYCHPVRVRKTRRDKRIKRTRLVSDIDPVTCWGKCCPSRRRTERSDNGKSRKEVKPEDTTREENVSESAGKGTVQEAVPGSPNQLMLF